MAHEIDQTTGQAAVFVTGQPAWHGLGTVIENAATSAEAIKLAGLDWTVQQWPVRAFDPHQFGSEARIDGFVANVRTDTRAVIGVVGKRYRVFQNREAFDFMDALVGDKLAMYETAGSLHGGRRVWMLAAIPKEYRAGADDLIKPYVLLTNTHDGSQALRMIPTTVRVVCQNTLNQAMREAGMRRNVLTYKAPPNNGGYDLICIHPDPHRVTRQIRVQVKSRYASDGNREFPVKAVTFTAFDFLIAAFLNIGDFNGGGDSAAG